MSGLVLDASVALAWCFRDEQSAEAIAILHQVETEFAIVPAIFPLELINVLGDAERRRRISAAAIAEFLEQIRAYDIRIDEISARRVYTDVLNLVRNEGLAAYDAAYLEIAVRSGLPLATGDRALASAARRNGVAVIRC